MLGIGFATLMSLDVLLGKEGKQKERRVFSSTAAEEKKKGMWGYRLFWRQDSRTFSSM